jgi:glucosyl-3-phosphoglycerate synthase
MPRFSVSRRDKAGNDRLSLAAVAEPRAGSSIPADGRAGSSIPAERWAKARSFHHSRYPASRIAAERGERGLGVSVCLPARECATTVAEIVRVLLELRETGAIDEIVVVDAGSADGTAMVAERAGAAVWQEAELMPSYGPVLGKGDAMWRALSVLEGELVCFLDADTEGFSAHFATGVLGPLVCEPGVSFVKGFYRRPLAGADGGGRVNHLTARPALELFYPQLARVRQPLAGEVAARRRLLERLPFATGYGVEIAMLIDVWKEVGLEGIAQVDLEEHRNRHRPLSALTPMALTVLATIARRLEREGRLTAAQPGGPDERARAAEHAPPERPPLAGLAAAKPARGSDGGPSARRGGAA